MGLLQTHFTCLGYYKHIFDQEIVDATINMIYQDNYNACGYNKCIFT